MAKKSTKSSIASRLKRNKTRKETRHKEAQPPGGGSLPAGIEAGIAKLTRLDFPYIKSGDYEGQQMLYYHGVCVQPKEIDTEQGMVKTEGLLVQGRSITLTDTKDWQGNDVSFDENFAKAENALKVLGVPTEEFDDETFEEEVVDYAKENEIYFRFRTWKPDPTEDNKNPRTQVVVSGVVEDYEPDEDEEDEIEDNTEDEEPPEDETVDEDDDDEDEDEADEPDEDEGDEDEDDDEPNDKALQALAKKADKGDEDAQRVVDKLSEKYDIDHAEDEENFPNWVSVAKAVIEARSESDDDEDEDEDDQAPPEEGDTFGYKPPRSKKVWECEVTAVNAKKQTVKLECEDNGKTYSNVPWDKLQEL